MKELNDEEIQSLLSKGLDHHTQSLSAFEQQQLDDYSFLFQELKAEPGYTLPSDFSATVSRKLQFRLKRRSDLKFNMFAALGTVVAFIVVYGLLSLIETDAADQFLLAVFKLKWVLLSGIIVLSGMLVFEQRVVDITDTAEVALKH